MFLVGEGGSSLSVVWFNEAGYGYSSEGLALSLWMTGVSKVWRAASLGRGYLDWTVSVGVTAIGSWMVGSPQCGEAIG